jgi:predicted double-glycine peptidase
MPWSGATTFRRGLFALTIVLSNTVTLAVAGSIVIPGTGGAASFDIPVTSMTESRWDTVIRQQYDFSCGSAAVATLLTYHYNRPVREDAVFREMFASGDKEKIRRSGFSMLDMKRFLNKRGLRADGFRLSFERIEQTGIPGIALVNVNGYRHFVVVKGIVGDRVLLGDPALGVVTTDRATFLKIWDGSILAARGDRAIAREQFNHERDWRAWPTIAPGEGMDRAGLGTFTLTLPGRNEFGG